MRVPINTSSFSCFAATLLAWVAAPASGISVPTGKLEPISPARPQPRTVNPLAPSAPAPVVEYSEDRPEPPPLDQSYKPYTYNYFDTLTRHHVYWVPVRYRNFNAQGPNDVEYEPPKKYFDQALGKNTLYKPYKRQLALPYVPVRPMDWGRQQWSSPATAQPTQFTTQYSTQVNSEQSSISAQPNNAQNNYNNEGSQNGNGYNGAQNYNYEGAQQSNGYNGAQNNGYSEASQASSQYPGHTVQPTQQQQQEALSTQSAPASTLTPQNEQQQQQQHQLTGKGSYDVTGKGGSGSEYYTKADWSKKAFPKKVLGGTSKYQKY